MLRIVEVTGIDAAEFLHRVTAGAVRSLEPGQGRAGLLLNGQSRVLAQFDVLRRQRDEFLLAAPAECALALSEGLERLHFAENLEITLTDQVVGARASAEPARAEPFAIAPDGGWPAPVPGFRFHAAPSAAAPPGWDYARIAALVPWPAREWQTGETPALEGGMLPWIDRHKGCYPGQEVVELSLNVGHPARVLVAVEAAEEPSWEGAVITSAAHESGSGSGRWRALVRLPWARKDILPSGISRIAAHW